VKRIAWSLVLLALPAVAGDLFLHPAGAYRLHPPAGWTPRVHFDPSGVPFYVFTPEPGRDPIAYRRGLWVHAVPIPSDKSLTLDSLLRFTAATTLAFEPGLRCDPDQSREIGFGGLNARVMELAGVHHTGGPWRGEIVVALQEDNFLAVSYGGPPEEWTAIQAAVGSIRFEGARALLPKEAAERPPIREKAEEVMAKLRPATPLITLLGPRGPLESHGTGFVLSADGYVVTSRRVLRRIEANGQLLRSRLDPVRLTFDATVGLEPVDADVVAISRKHDLALLKIRGGGPWPFLPLAAQADVRLAHRALLAGWPDPRQFGSKALNQNEGSVSAIPRDEMGRPLEYRLGARAPTGEEGGNAGGPVYDLHLGGVIGVLSAGLVYESQDGKIREVLYEGAVPAARIFWEFPQVAAAAEQELSADDRAALVGYYFMQERYGAAMLECARLLGRSPRHGMANAYLYRMLAALGEDRRAEQAFKYALMQKETEYLTTLFAADAALARGDDTAASQYAAKAMQLAPVLPQGQFLFARALELQDAQWIDRQCQTVLAMTGNAHPQAHALLGVGILQQWLRQRNVMNLYACPPLPDAQRLEAERHLERAIELWPSRQGLAHAYLAMLAAMRGDGQAFEEHRARALAEAGDDVEVSLRVAYVDLLTKRPFRALEILPPLSQTSDHPGVAIALAWAHGQIATMIHLGGDPEKAQEVMRPAQAIVNDLMRRVDRRAPRRWEHICRFVMTKEALLPPPPAGGGR